jgi:hypothetical protein
LPPRNRTRTIVFLGAGASRCCGIPTSKELTDRILELPGFEKELHRLKQRFRVHLVEFNTETLITYLSASSSKKAHFSEVGPILLALLKGNRGFTLRSVLRHKTLMSHVKAEIRNQCYVRSKQISVKFPLKELMERYDFFLRRLVNNKRLGLEAELGAGPDGRRIYPNLEFFTTNYDDVLETFFDMKGIPTTDGYHETMPPPGKGDEVTYLFDESEFDDSGNVRIYKIYGSVRYARYKSSIVRIEPSMWRYANGQRVIGDLLIYPGATKVVWNEPQLQLFYRLHRRLSNRKTSCCIVIGYSFGDRAIADVFLDALRLNPSLKVFVVGPEANATVLKIFGKSASVKSIEKTFEKLDPARDLR